MTAEFTIATHALVFLNHKGQNMTSEDIASNVCTNPARIRKVMAKLKRAGLVETREGAAHGGYRFCREAADVTLAEILDALDDTPVTSGWRSGDPDMDCLIASGMAGVMDQVFGRMNDACRTELGEITIQDLDTRLFAAGGLQPCTKQK